MSKTADFKIFSFFSLFFAISNLGFSMFGRTYFNGVAFLWIIAVNVAAGRFNSWKKQFLLIAMLLPLEIVLYRSTAFILFIGLMILLSWFFHYKEIGNRDYFTLLGQFRKELVLLGAVLAVTYVTSRPAEVLELVSLYAMIYLMSSVLLLRTLRVVENTKNPELINKMNARYSTVLIAGAFVISIDFVRNSILYVAGLIYTGFFAVFIYLMKLLFTVIYKSIKFVVTILGLSSSDGQSRGDDLLRQRELLKKLAAKSRYAENADPFYFNMLVGAIGIMLFLLAIFMLYRKYAKPRTEHLSFSEEKEFIEKAENPDRSIRKMLARIIKPGTNNELVRFYYKRFLRMCMSNKIQLVKSDSSSDVNRKAEEFYDHASLMELRRIYIRARYGEGQIDDESRKIFVARFSMLKKKGLWGRPEKNRSI